MTKALANAIQRIEDKLKIHHGEGDPLQLVPVKLGKDSKAWPREMWDRAPGAEAAIATLDEPRLLPRILAKGETTSTRSR